MRIYYLIRDTSTVKQDPAQRQENADNLRLLPFAGAIAARSGSANEQLQASKISLSGEYRLGGIDLDDPDLLALLDSESRQIDARFSQPQRQLELVLLSELRAALPQDDRGRSANLSVTAIAFGTRAEAIAGVQAYLQQNAGDWYP